MNLKIVKIRTILVTGFLSFLLLNVSCENQGKREEAALLGRWNALWETTMDDLGNIDSKNLRMHGLVQFNKNGKVEIEAFGHDGCVFSSDTLKNQLQWKLEGQTLRFIDEGDDSGLPYQNKSISDNKMELVLMDDIFLTLNR